MSYVYRKFSTLFKKGHFYDLFRIILKQKARPQSFSLVLKLKHDCSSRAKTFALTFCHPSTNKITGIQHDNEPVSFKPLHSSWDVQRVFLVVTKVEQGTIVMWDEGLLLIAGASVAKAVTH
jgi:hypothetical protein